MNKKEIQKLDDFVEEIIKIVDAHKEPYINEYDFQYDLCKNIEKTYKAKIYREHKALLENNTCSIDFIIELNKTRIPVEVKYRPNIQTIYWEGLKYNSQKNDEEVYDTNKDKLSDVKKMIYYVKNEKNKFPYGYCILLTNRGEWKGKLKDDRDTHNVNRIEKQVNYHIDGQKESFYLEVCQIDRINSKLL